MDEQTRYRVTGSLFLLAIAVICLPMLFDGEGLPGLNISALPAASPLPEIPTLDEVAPHSDVLEKVAELRAQVDDGFYTASGSRVGEPILTLPGEETRVWALQVASFRDADNAIKLRSELRGLGYEAFISTVRSESEVLTRVAVGPFLSKSEAAQLRDKLREEMEFDTRLMAFSN